MVSGPEEDFANFLEFSDLQLTFPTFDINGHNGGDVQQESAGGLDTTMENETELMDYKEGQIDQQMDQDVAFSPGVHGINGSTESLLDLIVQPQLFHQQQRQHQQPQMRNQYPQGRVPPTPNSIEMHGGHARYYPQVDPQAQAMYDRYTRNQKEQVRYTTLILISLS